VAIHAQTHFILQPRLIGSWVGRAAQAGASTLEEAAAWASAMEAAAEAGHFFLSSTHFIVAGRKT